MTSSSSLHYKPSEEVKAECIYPDKGGLVIKAKALDVVWGEDSRYWIKPEGTDDPLELKRVAWLEATCSIPINTTPLKKGMYKVNFSVSIKPETAFGWNGCPVYLMARVGQKKPNWVSADLSLLTKKQEVETMIPAAESKELTFEISEENANANLSLGLFEIWKGRWKEGLRIYRVNITPVRQRENLEIKTEFVTLIHGTIRFLSP